MSPRRRRLKWATSSFGFGTCRPWPAARIRPSAQAFRVPCVGNSAARVELGDAGNDRHATVDDSTAALRIVRFSSGSSELFSPQVPITIRPVTPSLTSASCTLGVVEIDRQIFMELRCYGGKNAAPCQWSFQPPIVLVKHQYTDCRAKSRDLCRAEPGRARRGLARACARLRLRRTQTVAVERGASTKRIDQARRWGRESSGTPLSVI